MTDNDTPATPTSETTTTQPTASAAPADTSPFAPDELLFHEGAAIRNELEEAQSGSEAARRLGAQHWSRLIYDPSAPWRGRAPYPQAPDKETL